MRKLKLRKFINKYQDLINICCETDNIFDIRKGGNIEFYLENSKVTEKNTFICFFSFSTENIYKQLSNK